MSKRQFRPVLVKYMELTVNIVLHQQQGILGHFFTVAVEQLNTVVIEAVVACGNHNATVEVIYSGNISHGRSSRNMQQVGIRPGGCQAHDQVVLEHVQTPTSIFVDNVTSRIGVIIVLTQSVIVPSQEPYNLIRMIRR